MERDRIIFTRTEMIDGRLCNTNIYDSAVRRKYGKGYFEMLHEEKAKAEYYFCDNPNFPKE